MCAISGAPTLQKAFDLYQAGLQRGHYSSGLLIKTKQNCFVLKQKEPFTYDEILDNIYSKDNIHDIDYCAFHSRAPTNVVEEEWNYDTTHPFDFGSYYVAHNGIINNFKSFNESSEFIIDSSLIPYHLHQNDGDICRVYEKYSGLLTSWIYEASTNNFFVIKAGSSLHMDQDSFSSVPFKGSNQIEKDGIIFSFAKNQKLEEISNFKYINPYFIL